MIWTLLTIFQLKHFIADYLLQGRYMLGKFNRWPHYVLPLLAHIAVHGAFTFSISICIVNAWVALGLTIFDMVAHAITDRIKASPDLLGRFKALSANEMKDILNRKRSDAYSAEQYKGMLSQDIKRLKSNTFFWYSLGLDQMVHHLTHYIIIWVLVTV